MAETYIRAQYLMNDVKTYLLTPRKGQGMVEYALILALIAIVVVGALTLLGGSIGARFTSIQNSLK